MLTNPDVDYSTLTVEKATDSFRNYVAEVGTVGVLVVFVLLDQGLRLVDKLVLVKIGSAAQKIPCGLFVIHLHWLAIDLHLYLAGLGSLTAYRLHIHFL